MRWVLEIEYVCLPIDIRCRVGVWMYAVLGMGCVLVYYGSCERESTGDIGNWSWRSPRFPLYLRDLIGKGCGRVDEWGARCADWRDVGLMSHDRGLPTAFKSMECGMAHFGRAQCRFTLHPGLGWTRERLAIQENPINSTIHLHIIGLFRQIFPRHTSTRRLGFQALKSFWRYTST